MNKANVTLLIAMAMLLAACFATPPVTAPAPSLSSINMTATSLAQFLTSAPRITAAATQRRAPTETVESMTTTPFPSITPLPTATSTFTVTPFGFKASATPQPPTETPSVVDVTPDPAEGATGDWGSDYRCTLIDKSPANWTVVPSGGKYKVSWTLQNTGRKRWQTDAMELAFIDGVNISKDERVTTLVRDVKVGESITPVINIYPPTAPGNYRAVWGLRLTKGGRVFCTFTVKVTVK